MKSSVFRLAGGLLLGIAMLIPLVGQSVPPPEKVLGFEVGDDYHLADYHQAMAYFRMLAESSDRMILVDAGTTSMGQTMTYAVISSPENLARLEQIKTAARRLSLGEGLQPEAARKLAGENPAVVYIDGGLHASECAPAQHNLQLAFDLASKSDPQTERILRDVVLVLVFANPDGMNLLAEWYHPNIGSPYEVSPMPRLYHIYAGHDNNRDSYLANLAETQIITRLVNQEWFPVILYNHHQTAPFPARIWTPPNSEPTNPNVHPLIVRWQNMVGSAMGAAFDAQGKEGAISRLTFDTWYPGYVTQVVDSHNIISILTETALYRYATPHFYTLSDFPEQYQDLTMSAFYPNPWKGGWWRLRDAVEYCLTASMAVLDTASKYRTELTYNKYRMAQDVIGRFKREPPYAWIIPTRQHDPGAVSLLLNRMILLGIQVERARDPFTCDGIEYPAGTHLIPMDQAFALFIKNVFEEQVYPDLRKYPQLWQGVIRPKSFEGAPLEAYDQMGWTLPHQFNARVIPANMPVETASDPVDEVQLRAGGIQGRAGFGYMIRAAENAGHTAVNRILSKKHAVTRIKKSFQSDGNTFQPGDFLVPAKGVPSSFMKELADDLNLSLFGISRRPQVESSNLRPARLGLYQAWVSPADEGWTRLILENHDFPYTTLHDAEIRAGGLRTKYDAILIPSMRSKSILEGHRNGTMPARYVGGITATGLRNLQEFARAGGTLIFLNQSCDLALENFRIPVRNALKGIARSDYVCSGSILRMEFDTDHPLAYGMTGQAPVIIGRGPAFEILPDYREGGQPVSAAKFPGNDLLMSGWIHGEKYLRRKSSVVEVPYGEGRLVLLGFPVQYRAQPYGTFKLLFNAVEIAGLGD